MELLPGYRSLMHISADERNIFDGIQFTSKTRYSKC